MSDLLNCTRLAEELDVWPGYVTAMRKAGYVFTAAYRTTLASALEWLADNPDFRAEHWLKAKPSKKQKGAARRSVSTGGK